jgi:hypothetical protein
MFSVFGMKKLRTRSGALPILMPLLLLLAIAHCCQVESFSPSFLSTRLQSSRYAASQKKNTLTVLSGSPDSVSSPVRFLGKGENAIVRPGVVLIAPSQEFHHYYRHAAIFIHAMGEDEYGEYVIRGVIVDHPTPFTLKEMTDPNAAIQDSPLGENVLFKGGDKGGDGIILLHSQETLGQSPIGMSGIYQGGWDAALAACANGAADVDDFKIFFNYCQFNEKELEDLLKSNEDGDCWVSVEVSADIVLDSDWDRGDAWQRLRNSVAQMKM